MMTVLFGLKNIICHLIISEVIQDTTITFKGGHKNFTGIVCITEHIGFLLPTYCKGM